MKSNYMLSIIITVDDYFQSNKYNYPEITVVLMILYQAQQKNMYMKHKLEMVKLFDMLSNNYF